MRDLNEFKRNFASGAMNPNETSKLLRKMSVILRAEGKRLGAESRTLRNIARSLSDLVLTQRVSRP